MGRGGELCDREGEEGMRVIGMRVIQRKGMRRGEGKRREEGRRKEMTWSPKQNSWIRHCLLLLQLCIEALQ
jgi:hypothetical protein